MGDLNFARELFRLFIESMDETCWPSEWEYASGLRWCTCFVFLSDGTTPTATTTAAEAPRADAAAAAAAAAELLDVVDDEDFFLLLLDVLSLLLKLSFFIGVVSFCCTCLSIFC